MTKKFLIVLIIGIFSLAFFWSNFCLAIEAPTLVSPSNGATDVPLAPTLDWEDVAGVDHYELYYKRASDDDWTDRYPSVSQYTVTGLSPETQYQWYVVSCGDPDCADSNSSTAWLFKTQELAPPPNDNGNGNGNGNGGNGGWVGSLVNPLKAETLEEAIDALLNFLFYLAIALGPLMIIYGAFLIMTAAGDADKINKGKAVISWTLVAIAIILLAKGLPSIIKGVLGG